MIKLRYPNITGIRPEDRQKQMESFVRYLVDTLNVILGSEKKVEEPKQEVQAAAPASAPSAVKENTKAIKANAEAIQANAAAIDDNKTSIQAVSANLESSLWYAVFALTADQTIATASTFQTLPLKAISARGSFLTLSSDGKKITFSKKMAVTISAQLYFSSGYSVDQQVISRINLNGNAWISGRGRCDTASPYITVPISNRSAIVNAGDYIELQAYSSGSGGIVGLASAYTWLNIDVKGIIE